MGWVSSRMQAVVPVGGNFFLFFSIFFGFLLYLFSFVSELFFSLLEFLSESFLL